ncbi:hypothetical protein LEP1GSC037_3387 [Leptospira interrogans str. 2006001854]|uniref:Uncharacterized protein n=1 Tax=Leptospira interrogans str. 2006001854 TaxID=1001590 RepID=M6GJJ7_LEPIR|nr:hypothetical protein LEP1GSC037_3387 [Leptospira interrogans str. 2006001854]
MYNVSYMQFIDQSWETGPVAAGLAQIFYTEFTMFLKRRFYEKFKEYGFEKPKFTNDFLTTLMVYIFIIAFLKESLKMKTHILTLELLKNFIVTINKTASIAGFHKIETDGES